MKKVVYLVSPSDGGLLEQAGDRPPLGLLYIAKNLILNGVDVDVFDLNHSTEEDLFSRIEAERPDLVGVSCLSSPSVNRTRELLKKLKDLKQRTIVGGFHPSVRPTDFTDLSRVVSGEGEIATLNALRVDKPIYLGEDIDLTLLGKPQRDLLEHKYLMNLEGLNATTMMTSRGCPNNCVFCGNRASKIRYHNLSDIARELDDLKGYGAVYIVDDVFTINKQRAVEIARLLKNRNLKFRCTTRANFLDDRLSDDLAENGCLVVSLGVETGNEEMLRRISKNQTKGDIRNAVRNLTKSGIKSKGFFIYGLPFETEDSADDTYNFAQELKDLGLTYADFYSMTPYPGSLIERYPARFGLRILDRDYEHYLQTGEPVIEGDKFSREQIKQYIDRSKRLWKN